MTRGDAIALAAVILVSVPVLLTAFRYGFSSTPTDETLVAWLGKLVVLGELPYQDFFTYFPPGLGWTAAVPAMVGGPGVGPLRILMMFLILCGTVALYAIARSRGASSGWAAATALWLPLVLVPLWPMTSHQWLATTIALVGHALLLTYGRSTAPALTAGVILAWAALIDQLVGSVSTAILLLLLFGSRRFELQRWRILAGFGSVFAVVMLWLIVRGVLLAAIRNVILWPLLHYKQPDGYNSAAAAWLFGVPGSRLSPIVSMGDELAGAILFLLLLTVVLGLMLEPLRAPRASRWRPWALDLALIALASLGFAMGRPDLPHLVFWTPAALIVMGRLLVAERLPLGSLAVKIVLVAGLLLSTVRFGGLWTSYRPSLSGVLVYDRAMSEYVMSTVVDVFPDARRTRAPIAVLSWTASAVYLYWSPAPAPVDWVMRPSDGFSSTAEYEAMAQYIRRNDIRFLVVPEPYLEEFEATPTPLSPLLHEFTPLATTPFGAALQRSARIRNTASPASAIDPQPPAWRMRPVGPAPHVLSGSGASSTQAPAPTGASSMRRYLRESSPGSAPVMTAGDKIHAPF